MREQDGVTETREKRVGEKGERRRYREKEKEIRKKEGETQSEGSEKTWKRSPTFHYGVIRSFFTLLFRSLANGKRIN